LDTGGTGDPNGSVKLVAPSGDVYQFATNFLFCGHDGGGGPGAPHNPQATDPNIANTEGPGTKNGIPGYYFAATIHDHGEGWTGIGNTPQNGDEFAVSVADTSGTTIFLHTSGIITSGNIQIQTTGI
jgi:hypothetical protein